MTFFRFMCAWLALAAAGMGCGHAQIKRGYAEPSQQELLGALHERQDATKSLNLETRTTSWLGGDRVRATVLMLVQREGKLRFEAEVSLKGTVAALTTDGQGFSLLDMERNEFKQGPACPANVASLVRIPLAPNEIAAILLGDAPLQAESKLVATTWDAEMGAERLSFETPGENNKSTRLNVFLRRESRGWAVVAVEGLATNTMKKQGWWRVRYEELTPMAGVYFPNIIRFAEPNASFDDGVEIKIKDRRINPEIPEDSFHLKAPSDFFIQNVNCGGV
jgi:hypothetical protein